MGAFFCFIIPAIFGITYFRFTVIPELASFVRPKAKKLP